MQKIFEPFDFVQSGDTGNVYKINASYYSHGCKSEVYNLHLVRHEKDETIDCYEFTKDKKLMWVKSKAIQRMWKLRLNPSEKYMFNLGA